MCWVKRNTHKNERYWSHLDRVKQYGFVNYCLLLLGNTDSAFKVSKNYSVYQSQNNVIEDYATVPDRFSLLKVISDIKKRSRFL